MNDWPLEQEILILLIRVFAWGTLLILCSILIRKIIMKLQLMVEQRVEQRYLGYLTNAIDSKVHGIEKDYQLHVQKLKGATSNSLVRKGVVKIFNALEKTVSGDYGQASKSLRSDLGLEKKRVIKSNPWLVNIQSNLQYFVKLLSAKKVSTYSLVRALQLEHAIVPNQKSFSEMEKIKIFNELSKYEKDQFPDLEPALAIKKAEVLQFMAEVIGRFKLTQYVSSLVAAGKHLKREGDVIIGQCLGYYKSRSDLMELQTVLSSCEDFDTKKVIVDHFKKECLS